MKKLIRNVKLPAEYGFGNADVSVEVVDSLFGRIGADIASDGEKYDEIIDGKGRLLLPGLYNTHCRVTVTDPNLENNTEPSPTA